MLNIAKLLGIGKKRNGPATSITTINIAYMGDRHSLGGMQAGGEVFEVRIPFQNRTGSDMLADEIKRPDLRVESASVSAPFELLDVSPKLPIAVKYMQSVVLVLKLRAPKIGYAGPMSITLNDKAASTARLEISRIAAVRNGQSYSLEDAPSIANVQKNQVLRRDVQLYRFMKYGDAVKGISVNKPFAMSGSEPKAPFTIDKADSFIVSVYVLAPEHSYSGPLEFTFE